MSVAGGEPVLYNTDKWIEENEKYFLPPVCNKMMHNEGQLKVFYVGGPNQRKDYHIEEGEELFYMLKGDMCLKILEKGKHRDVPIKQGEIFLLPARIPHSPQRQKDTIGLVLERDRDEASEKDGLRYYVEENGVPTTNSLFERWFYCSDLGTQLKPIITEYFASEQHKTGKPIPGTIPENPPVTVDTQTEVESPYNLHKFIDNNRGRLNEEGKIVLFQEGYQFQVFLLGKGDNDGKCGHAETFIWQLEGKSDVKVEGKNYSVSKGDTFLIRCGQSYSVHQEQNAICLLCFQDASRK